VKFSFGPQTKWGEHSVALLIICGCFLIAAKIVVSIQHPLPNQPLFSNLALDIPMLSAITAAILGGMAGIRAIIQDKERSITVSFSALVGLCILFLVVRQFVAPF